MLLAPFGYEITQKTPIEFHCNCNRLRVERALISLGKAELTQIMKEQGKAEIICHFCNTVYNFGYDDLSEIVILSTT
jgi:molecular chaperone Hsp33